MADLNEDTVLACADLVGRAGAVEFEMGWDCPHAPDVADDHNCGRETWHAVAKYRGARITAEGHRSPSGAALALAERLLTGATCRCQQPVSLSDAKPGCRWRLVGRTWEPGCDEPSIHIGAGNRGNWSAMQRALADAPPTNRAERRAAKRKRGHRD